MMRFLLLLYLFILIQTSLEQAPSASSSSSSSNLDFNYQHYVNLTNLLVGYRNRFPNNTYLYSIGQSVLGRQLWVLAIADSNPQEHQILRPEAKYIGNMHGNEVPSKEVLVDFLEYMLNNQQSDPNVQFLMKNTRIHVLPSLNPDGFENSFVGDCTSVQGRYNSKNYDLNRNFPDQFVGVTVPTQPETSAVMNWLAQNEFVLSANFHEGSFVVNYPYDNYANANGISRLSLCDDNDVFFAMALNYTANNVAMRAENIECTVGENFINGTTNGALWYPATGTMQDYNYWRHGSMEVTIELGCCKYPQVGELKNIWDENRQALIDYMKFANTGVRGLVKFPDGTVGQNLTVQIDAREPAFKTGANGEYYRILLPGQYTLSILIGCANKIYQAQINVPSNGIQLLEYNITLPIDYLSSYKTASLDRYAVYCSKQNNQAK